MRKEKAFLQPAQFLKIDSTRSTMKWQWNEGEGKEAASDNTVKGTHGPMGPTPCHEMAASSFPHLTSPELQSLPPRTDGGMYELIMLPHNERTTASGFAETLEKCGAHHRLVPL